MKIEINIDINDRLVAFFRKIFTTRNAIFGIAALLFGLSMLLFANHIPALNEFSSGQLISSKLVNDNFKNLWDKVNEHDDSINGLSGGSGSWWNRNEDGTLYYNQNNVGVGTASPQTKLDVAGDLRSSGKVYTKTGSGGSSAVAIAYSEWAPGQIWKIVVSADPPANDTQWGEFTLFIRPSINNETNWYKILTVTVSGCSLTKDGSNNFVVSGYSNISWSAIRLR
jgi:hypothetical protein